MVVTFAAGECFGVLRRAGYHPATLLGLVGTVALMIAAYTKGASAIPLVLVLIVVFTFLWYLFGVERGAPVAGVGRHAAHRGLDLAAGIVRRPVARSRRPSPTVTASPSCSAR